MEWLTPTPHHTTPHYTTLDAQHSRLHKSAAVSDEVATDKVLAVQMHITRVTLGIGQLQRGC